MTDNQLNLQIARARIKAAQRYVATAKGPYEQAAAQAQLKEAELHFKALKGAERG